MMQPPHLCEEQKTRRQAEECRLGRFPESHQRADCKPPAIARSRSKRSSADGRESVMDEQQHCARSATGPFLCGVAEVLRSNRSRSQSRR